MTADQDPEPAARVLREAARELAEVATTLREVSRHATAAATDGAVHGSLRRAPAAGARAQRAVLRAVTDRRGLGYSMAGGPVGALGSKLGGMARMRSLAVRMMTTSLRLRIAAVCLDNPELVTDPLLARLHEAVAAEREMDAVRALCTLIRNRGTARTLSAIAPIFGEFLALRALLDRNPLNDRTAWLIASGEAAASADPITGLSNRAIAALDVGEGAARRTASDPGEAARLGAHGSLLDFLTNIRVVGPTGRALVQTVTGPDGTRRHVVQVPGMRIGHPDLESPADLLGAFSSTLMDSAPFSRALAKAIEDYGVPPGEDVALIGHSAGGGAVMNLAQDPRFCARHPVTHVVAIGSPIDFKRPVSPHTWVASITNQHDLIPSLDGQGAGSCFDLHPDWYVVDYTDPAHVFPACHGIDHYTANIVEDLPEVRARLEEQLRPFQGPVVRSQLYRLYDREPGATTTSVVTTTGGTVRLPLRCLEGNALTAYFTADPAAVARLPGEHGRAVRVGGRALVALHAFENRGTPLGDYGEAHLGVVVADPNGSRPSRLWRELLPSGEHRGLGTCFLRSVLTTDRAHAVAAEVWGHSASVGRVRVAGGDRPVSMTVADTDGTVLTLAGSLGRRLPFVHRDLVVYSWSDGIPQRSHIQERGRRWVHPSPGMRLTIGSSGHPLARWLDALGLDGARPVLCLVAPARSSLRSPAVPLPAH
ncbi:hypothetical protein [Actinomadura xylanilytica]|uniref:hypothetical protein n=1 Tax=Actinomadura xylanilytica TaxID=887459 RepID=UPI00255AD6E2|nr:hypothetical protein [Actinomadura xylanilytica]MDL4775241.1 hypothetical protein [Actinomadura xylanilytica]